jgi:hypothetical protein
MTSNFLLALALMLVSLLAFSCRDKSDKDEGQATKAQPAAAESAGATADESPDEEGAGAPDDEGEDEAEDEGEDEAL